MNKILYRVKINLFKRKMFIYETVIFTVLFSMLFLSIYISNISKKTEDEIISQFNIYSILQSKYTGGKTEEIDIEEYETKTSEFLKIVNEMGEYASYYDINFTNMYKMPLFKLKIDSNGTYIAYLFNSNTSSSKRYHQIMNENKKTESLYTLNVDSIKGVINSTPIEFQLGISHIAEGRLFTNEEMEEGQNVCIVNEQTVVYDGQNKERIKVGDTITFSEYFENENGKLQFYKEHEYKVIGTFYTTNGESIVYPNMKITPIYIPFNSYKEMTISLFDNIKVYDTNYLSVNKSFIYYPMMHSAYFHFNDLDTMINFVEKLESYKSIIGKENEIQYFSTIDDYYPTINNIMMISSNFSNVSYLCLIICILVTIIIILFEITNRNEEIGLLLTLGESKSAICMQFSFESIISLLTATIISFTLILNLGDKLIYELIYLSANKNNDIANFLSSIFFDYSLSSLLFTCLLYLLVVVCVLLFFINLIIKNRKIVNLLRRES